MFQAKPDAGDNLKLNHRNPIRVHWFIYSVYRFHYLQNGSDLKYVARVALQVFIKPESYDVGAETIGAQEDIDPGFSNQELEWSTARRGAVVLSGVLVQLREQN